MLSLFRHKIDFLVVGAQKAGTSALDHYLRQHPQIAMPPRQKELHFFDDDRQFERGKPDYRRYERHWDKSQRGKTRGEVTPIYMFWPDSPRRIYRYNPQIKLIAVLRNPVERAFSHWHMEKERGNEKLDFGDAIGEEQERLSGGSAHNLRVYSYLHRGFYARQVEELMRHFDQEQLCFIKYETFLHEARKTLNQLFEFLEVQPGSQDFQPREVFKTDYQSQISSTTRRELSEVFEDDIRKLEKILDWDCKDWRWIS